MLTRFGFMILSLPPQSIAQYLPTMRPAREKTNVSLGPLLPMTSTRRQDYSICQYRLIKHFSNFLQSAPLVATQAAIQSLNFFIIKEHITGYLKDHVEFQDLIETFEFRGKSAYFVPDSSHIWDETSYSDEPIEIADELFKFIASLASSPKLYFASRFIT